MADPSCRAELRFAFSTFLFAEQGVHPTAWTRPAERALRQLLPSLTVGQKAVLCRMRTKPLGRMCNRKRRMKSVAASSMTFT